MFLTPLRHDGAMLWFTKKNKKKQGQVSQDQVGKGDGQRPSREELQQQALANAKAAREAIGEDTLDRIAAAMAKKQQSLIEQTKAKIREKDADEIADGIRGLRDH